MTDERTGRGFTDEEQRTLALVLDAIVPPSADGRLPGAGALGIGAYLDAALRTMPDLRAMVAEGLAELEQTAQSRHGRSFDALGDGERDALLAGQAFVFALTLQVYAGYYQHPRIVTALGLEPRPPHPEGYAMEPNDWSVLEPVRRRSTIYRKC